MTLLALTPALLTPANAVDPYSVIEALLPREKLPRLLNTVDWKIDVDRPLPHATIHSDFDGDGRMDLAISGTFGTPGDGARYFLLIAPEDAWRDKRRLHYEEAPQPYFLHPAGSTGPADPGDQAFSAARCAECDTGVDYYWDASRSRFRTVFWSRPLVAPPPDANVTLPEVELALGAVGKLDDVRELVSRIQADDTRALVTRAEPGEAGSVWIVILTRHEGVETIYDRIRVDLRAGSILERERAAETTTGER